VSFRKLRLCSHEKMKINLQEIWSGYERQGNLETLAGYVEEYMIHSIRPELLSFLSTIKKEDDMVLLATAAPEEYVSSMVKLIHEIDDYVATPRFDSGEWFHNIGILKWKSIRGRVGQGYRQLIVFTDHQDDIPLIEHSDRVYLFPPLASRVSELQSKYQHASVKIFHE